MIDQTEESNILAETIGWVAVNLLAISFIGVSFYISNINVIVNNKVIQQTVDNVGSISFLGGGIIIAAFQWIFLRNHLPQITGGGWIWVISGLVSSIGCFFSVGVIAILGLGDHPREIDYLFISILTISGQMICLSIVQGLILHSNKYKKAFRWVVSNILGYGLVVIFSYNPIYIWTGSFEMRFILPTLLMLAATWVSGWELMRSRDSRDDEEADNSIREAGPKNKNLYFVHANLENRDLRGQNFDGVDFRKANLRMAVLEDASCEPVKVQKMSAGWFTLFQPHTLRDESSPYFEEAMKPTNFSEADLTGANLKHAKLREANLHSAILRNANLTDAILINSDLSEANLSNANLSYTDMSGALLYKTNLEGADLTGTKLDGTDFEGANLKNAILHDVDLRKVKYLGSANLTGTDLSSAIMPEKK